VKQPKKLLKCVGKNKHSSGCGVSAGEDIKACVREISDTNNADIYLISGGLNYPIDDRTLSIIEEDIKK